MAEAAEKPKEVESKTQEAAAAPSVKEVEKQTKVEQERNDAAKVESRDEGYGTGIPPVKSEVDARVPVPVSPDAPKEVQEEAVALQSPGPRNPSDDEVKITTRDGSTVTVNASTEQVQAKVRDGNIVQFKDRESGDVVSVNPAHIQKVEKA